MGWFDELDKGVRLQGVVPPGPVTVIDVDRLSADVVNLTYEDSNGNIRRELVYRDSDVELLAGSDDRQWSFDADPEMFMLAAEAKRISLAYLFDPYLATHSSDVELLPHQIEAVYIDMLPNSPLRFLLADDPGAGKTIMAGLLIKELIARGDLAGAADFVLTNSEIIAALNNAEHHILALVEVADDDTTTVRYLYDPYTGRLTEPGYGEQKRVLSWSDYWNLATSPQ